MQDWEPHCLPPLPSPSLLSSEVQEGAAPSLVFASYEGGGAGRE